MKKSKDTYQSIDHLLMSVREHLVCDAGQAIKAPKVILLNALSFALPSQGLECVATVHSEKINGSV